MAPNDSLLTLRLDAETVRCLEETGRQLRDSAAELLACPGADFVSSNQQLPQKQENAAGLHMTFVFLGPKLCQLTGADAGNLATTLQALLAEYWQAATKEEPLHFRGFELLRSDLLIARFRAPDALLKLRKAVWRTCGAFGVTFPDSLWIPHVRLGRIRASKPQLARLQLSRLAALAPKLPARATCLALCSETSSDIEAAGPTLLALKETLRATTGGPAGNEEEQDAGKSTATREQTEECQSQSVPVSPPKGAPKAGVAPARKARVQNLSPTHADNAAAQQSPP
mmetsp:Transcript_13104/g.30618  ORF Transcript_13104/g.30618 Transcript_13104/m.30618 type:complete len:284 (-) Transcript_13104:32-883(-)